MLSAFSLVYFMSPFSITFVPVNFRWYVLDDIPSEVHRDIVIKWGDIKYSNEKADNILVLQMVFAATENQKGFSVIADYTDVFVLLCFIIWFICSISIIFTLHRWFILLNFS